MSAVVSADASTHRTAFEPPPPLLRVHAWTTDGPALISGGHRACMHGRPTVRVSSAAGDVRAVGACHQLYQPLHQRIALELRKNSYGFGAMARTDREPMWRPS